MIQSPLKIHLCCGDRRLPSYCHVDVRDDVLPDVRTNALDLNAFQSNSVQEVYFCHGLEHIKPQDVDQCLAEIHRVLIPDAGTIRLALPDFHALTTLYHEESSTKRHYLCHTWTTRLYENTHFFSWDQESLTTRLTKNRFMNVHIQTQRLFTCELF